MARLLVEIDDGLKRELKIRLIREGVTLKAWLTSAADAYVRGSGPPLDERPRSAGPLSPPRRSRHSPVAAPPDERRPADPVSFEPPRPPRRSAADVSVPVRAPTEPIAAPPIRRRPPVDDYLD